MLTEKEISSFADAGRGEMRPSLLPFVSVIMPVRNEAAFIERSVGAVASQDYPHDRMEILIADGMSEDGTRDRVSSLQQRHSNLKLIDNPEKIVAAGLNAALRVAQGEIIVRVDGHCEIAPDYLRRCVLHLLQDDVVAVGGPVETIGESPTARAIATAMSSYFGIGGSAFRIANSGTQFTDTVAFPAYTRSVLERGGPFDEELVRNQDDEYNYRLRKLGVKILLASDVRSRYYSRATLAKLGSQYFQYGYWKVRVMQKHPRQMQLRQFVPPLFVFAVLGGLLMTPILPLMGYVTGLIATLYAVAVIACSIYSAQRSKWQTLPLLPIAFAILHWAYGLGFLFGLVKFWNRWGKLKNRAQPVPPIPELDKYESV
jgi:succinoglycan biosynthesis protein ExoA